MAEKISKNDFIEMDFTGTIADTNEIFDTTIKQDAKNSNLNINAEKLKPFIFSVGNKMLPQGFDENIEGKELNKEHEIILAPEKAFGKRNPQLVKMIPTKHFHEQQINPQRGMQLSLDGQLVKILSSSGGRTLVDFNHPLAGKKIKYKYKAHKKISDDETKINSLQDFLFRKQFPFKHNKEKKQITFTIPKKEQPLQKFIEMMSKPFEDILNLKVLTEISDKVEKEIEKPQPTEKTAENNN